MLSAVCCRLSLRGLSSEITYMVVCAHATGRPGGEHYTSKGLVCYGSGRPGSGSCAYCPELFFTVFTRLLSDHLGGCRSTTRATPAFKCSPRSEFGHYVLVRPVHPVGVYGPGVGPQSGHRPDCARSRGTGLLATGVEIKHTPSWRAELSSGRDAQADTLAHSRRCALERCERAPATLGQEGLGCESPR